MGALRTDRRGAGCRVHNLAGFGHTAFNQLNVVGPGSLTYGAPAFCVV
jgi:hypothetical protein